MERKKLSIMEKAGRGLTGLALASGVAGCAIDPTPLGRAVILSTAQHATNEAISRKLNPQQTNVTVNNNGQGQIVQQQPQLQLSTGIINNVRADYDDFPNNMNIHSKIQIFNNKGYLYEVGVYFYDKNGNKLIGNDGYNEAPDGHIAIGKKIQSPYSSSVWSDLQLSIPCAQLIETLPSGKNDLMFNLELFELEPSRRILAKSSNVYFWINK
tara:strand:- start:101 stop:736 length:636 start_codon:yes stop_codon:yes gene_type:complete